MALLGSFNLSFSALWGKEEIGVSIDDVETLKILEGYADDVIASSEPHGYTAKARRQELAHDDETSAYIRKYNSLPSEFDLKPIDSVTRGWLLEKIIEECVTARSIPLAESTRYLSRDGAAVTTLSFTSTYDLIKLATSNLDAFYTKTMYDLLEHGSRRARQSLLRRLFHYRGKNETDKILNFLKTKFARTHIPKISPAIISMPKQE